MAKKGLAGVPRRGSTKRPAAEESAFVPDVQPPESKRPRGGWQCRRCSAKPSDDCKWAAFDEAENATSDACMRCWRPFQAEYQKDGDWADVCDRQQNDEEYAQSYEVAAAVMSGERPLGFPQEEVTSDDAYFLDTKRAFVGVRRADYERITHGASGSHGFPETDCPNEFGQGFKGVVLENPEKPWIEYDLVHRQQVSRKEWKLSPSSLCRKEQPTSIMAAARSEHENDKFITRLRNCTATLSDVEVACGENGLLKKLFALRSGDDGEASGLNPSVGEAPLPSASMAMSPSQKKDWRPPMVAQPRPLAPSPMLNRSRSFGEAASVAGSDVRSLAGAGRSVQSSRRKASGTAADTQQDFQACLSKGYKFRRIDKLDRVQC